MRPDLWVVEHHALEGWAVYDRRNLRYVSPVFTRLEWAQSARCHLLDGAFSRVAGRGLRRGVIAGWFEDTQ